MKNYIVKKIISYILVVLILTNCADRGINVCGDSGEEEAEKKMCRDSIVFSGAILSGNSINDEKLRDLILLMLLSCGSIQVQEGSLGSDKGYDR